MAKKNQHVIRRSNERGVRGEASQRDTSRHHTQAEAIERAREIARNQQPAVVIHDPHGRIRDKDSYGNDPHPPTDRRH